MAKSNHICKFKKITYKSGNQVYFCTLPDCNKKINPALALGKRSICWRCGNDFILSDYSLRLVKPHCDACHKPKAGALHFENGSIIENVETQLDDALVGGENLFTTPQVMHHELSLSDRMKQLQQKPNDDEDL